MSARYPVTGTQRTTQLESELWFVVLGEAQANSTPIVALAVSGMNDVLNSQVADIDTPRRGIIRVTPRNLTSLAESLRPH